MNGPGARLDLASVLGPGGALAAAHPAWESRPAQLELARRVAAALERRTHLLAEAGTGTGKTLAYLVPAVLSGRRVVVSTATRTLQDQLFDKDLPLLGAAGLPAHAALLKGRANYLCLQRFQQFEGRPLFDTPADAQAWDAVRDWAGRTATGDRAELDVPDDWSAWAQLSTTSDGCHGARCPRFEDCFVTRARRAAEQAQLVVVNHALFFADLALRARGEGLGLQVLPPYDAVVFDEAHALEDVATEHFGTQVSSGKLLGLSQDAVKAAAAAEGRLGLLAAQALALRAEVDRFFAAAQDALGLVEDGERRLDAAALAPLRAKAGPLLRALEALAAGVPEVEGAGAALARRALEGASQLSFVLEAAAPGHVFWAQRRGRGLWLRAAPIEVGRTLAEHLYAAAPTCVFTSATLLAPGQGTRGEADFGYVVERLGLAGRSWDAVEVPSPFDWPRQAALYLPRGFPEPNAKDFTRAVADEVVELCRLTGGRAFVLFTSLRQMDAVHALAAPRLDVPALLQGERPRRALLDAFRARPSVLFAAQSFWEGVDVPGDALSLVVIDKLPFLPPGSPLVAARIDAVRERGGDAFSDYQVPQAALALRQGFGRLIRSRTDRGVVAVLDSRLASRGYGRAFLAALPPAARLTERDQVARWWVDSRRR